MRYGRRLISEDLFNLKAVNDPQISPDGSSVAYVETIMDHNTNKYKSRIWVVSTSGFDKPRFLTSGSELDYAPRWSPDGIFIAFISTRWGSPQLWIMKSTGEELQLLSHIRNVAGAPVWSPDGRTIACIVRLSEEDKEREGEQELSPRERFSKDVLVIDRLRYKLDNVGFLVNKNWHLFTVQAIGSEKGAFQQLTFGNHNFSSPAWSPDGRFISVAGNRISERTELDLVNDIWVVPSSGGTLRRLTRSTGPANYPSWSPDGRFIAYTGHDRRSGYYTNRGIWIVPWEGGNPKELTAGFKYPVGDYAIKDVLGIKQPGVTPCWGPDGKSIYMNVSANGAVHLWRFSVPEGRGSQITYGELVIYNLSFNADVRRVAMAVTSPTLPNDIWVGEINGESVHERRLTRVNHEWLDRFKLARPIRFAFRSPGGPDGEGWILHPPYSTAKKPPGILQIHGGPTIMYGYVFFFEFQLLAANGFAVIYTNPRGSMGYGQTFVDAIRGDWGNHDYADLMTAVEVALSQKTMDPECLGVAGGSYGGYMTNWIVTQTNRFKAAISMRGISNLYSFFGTSDGGFLHAEEYGGPPWKLPQNYLSRSPISFVDKVETPLLLIHSDRDFRVPIEQGEQFYTALKSLGRHVRMVRFLTETHELSREGEPWHRVIRLDHILRWFREYLKKNDGQGNTSP
ncbi:S9 family peptidase [Paenibacillus elgii]